MVVSNLSISDLMEKIGNNRENQIKTNFDFVNGDKYEGGFKFSGKKFYGYGKLELADGTVYDGLWEEGQFVFSKSILQDQSFDMDKLENGYHELPLSDGKM